MEMNNPTFQETLVELFLNTFSSPSWSEGTFRPKTVGTANMVQRNELEGKGGQSSRVDSPVCPLLPIPPWVFVPTRALWPRTQEVFTVWCSWVFTYARKNRCFCMETSLFFWFSWNCQLFHLNPWSLFTESPFFNSVILIKTSSSSETTVANPRCIGKADLEFSNSRF